MIEKASDKPKKKLCWKIPRESFLASDRVSKCKNASANKKNPLINETHLLPMWRKLFADHREGMALNK